MSTKIYNGYKIESCSAFELKQIIDNIINKARDIGKELMIKRIAEEIINIIDELSLDDSFELDINSKFGIDINDHILVRYKKDMFLIDLISFVVAEKYKKQMNSNERDLKYDFDFKISVFPLKDKILLLVFNEKNEYYKCIEETKEIKPYPYWDNTDKPDELTDEEWDTRRKEWDEVFGGNGWGVPLLESLSATAFCDISLPIGVFINSDTIKKEIKEFIPTFKERIQKRAKNIVLEEEMNKRVDAIEDENKKKLTSTFSHCYYETIDFLKTREGKNILKAKKDEISQKLKKRITFSDLYQTISIKQD